MDGRSSTPSPLTSTSTAAPARDHDPLTTKVPLPVLVSSWLAAVSVLVTNRSTSPSLSTSPKHAAVADGSTGTGSAAVNLPPLFMNSTPIDDDDDDVAALQQNTSIVPDASTSAVATHVHGDDSSALPLPRPCEPLTSTYATGS